MSVDHKVQKWHVTKSVFARYYSLYVNDVHVANVFSNKYAYLIVDNHKRICDLEKQIAELKSISEERREELVRIQNCFSICLFCDAQIGEGDDHEADCRSHRLLKESM